MVKEPRAGRVKTRLGRDLGMTEAAWWYRHQTSAVLRRLRDARWRLVLSVSPDHCAGMRRIWPHDLARIAQGRGDLGARMVKSLRHVPTSPVCLIGSDIAMVRRAHIARAFRRLNDHQMVLGPATDGGYWLIGAARGHLMRRNMLGGIRWSQAETLNDTLDALSRFRVALTDELADIDTRADLEALKATQEDRFFR